MENINTLHIVGHLPSNKIPIAGQIISYNWLLNSKESKCKYLLVLCNNRELEYKQDLLNELCGELEIIPISRNKKFLNFLLNINQPYLTANRISANIKKRIHLIIKQYAIKKVVYEFTSTYGYYLYLKNIKPLEHSFIAHDISFQALHRKYKKFKWIKKLFYYFEYRRVKDLEVKCFHENKVFILSEKDRQLLLEEKLNFSKIFIKKPILSEWIKSVSRSSISPGTILFLGGLHRQENLLGIKWFIEKVFFKLLEHNPNIILTIIGKNPEKLDKYIFNHPNIELKGFVSNIKPYFESTAIAISPLTIGAGVKIKTLEYLEAKIPTVSTSIGAEGINSNELLYITDEENEFIKIIELLLIQSKEIFS